MDFAQRKCAAKFICVKTVSGKVVRHSLAYLSVHKWLVGGRCPLLREILGRSDTPHSETVIFQAIFARSVSVVKTSETSSSAIAEKPRCSVGQFWVVITPYSADRPISIKSNQIEIID